MTAKNYLTKIGINYFNKIGINYFTKKVFHPYAKDQRRHHQNGT